MSDLENAGDEPLPLIDVLSDLVARAKILLSELQDFRDYLRQSKQELNVMVANFSSTVQSELAMLERLFGKQDEESAIHVARSSNLTFLETVWTTAKQSENVISLKQRVYPNSPTQQLPQAMRHVHINNTGYSKGPKQTAVTVDAMIDNGRTWIKVSLVTNTRLLFDLAKQGWAAGLSDEEYDDVNPDSAEDTDSDIPLVKTAKDICRAARSFRVRTKRPQVRLILPRVQPNETPEIDTILADCRKAGAVLVCGKDIATPAAPLTDLFRIMAPDPIVSFSETLNIDCTILLALVSEFSHAKVSKEPWFHTSLQRQVEVEGNENLLPSLLYPALGNHRMVCTKEAAKRMREIVDTIGTPSEKARTSILMGDETSRTQGQLVDEMQQWSAYAVPHDWRLPIYVVDQNENDCQSRLPAEAAGVGALMTAINKSVFLYGWASGNTTITSNRVVSRQIEGDLEKHDDIDETVWPSIWLCPTARSLVGKEKRSNGNTPQKPGVWSLTGSARKDQQGKTPSKGSHAVGDPYRGNYACPEGLEVKNEAKDGIDKRRARADD